MTTHRGYQITDGNHDMAVCAETRSAATGVFIAQYAGRIDWRNLRTRREPAIDGDEPWVFDVGAFATVEYWGASVRML